MELYLIRHAIAVDRCDPAVQSDAERWLTDRGIEKMKQAAMGLHAVLPALDFIYSSPYIRARQTADILLQAYKNKPMMVEIDDLAPGAGMDAIEIATQGKSADARIALVGHEPDLSQLIALLVTGTHASDIEMKKGAVCRVDFYQKPAPGAGVLVWLLQPKLLRKIH